MSRQTDNYSQKSRLDSQTHSPIANKIQQMHMRTLEQLLSLYCQLIGELAKAIDQYDIHFTSQQISSKNIAAIKEAAQEIKYYHKIHEQAGNLSLSTEIQQSLQLLAKLRIKDLENALPKVKRNDEEGRFPNQPQLSTIAERESEQNLLHNYLKKGPGGSRQRSKSNIGKNSFIYNTSSIEDIEFEVIRQQTRKSLDNPYHKNNQTRKGLYNDLQKIKGQDSLFPAVKNYLDKHKKHPKGQQYLIHKLI